MKESIPTGAKQSFYVFEIGEGGGGVEGCGGWGEGRGGYTGMDQGRSFFKKWQHVLLS